MAKSGSKDLRIPYLDGLRAYSILVVVLGHISVTSYVSKWKFLDLSLTNANLGVRVFFVLSGFLITTLLLNEHSATGRISIRAFYERRIARIFPAFYLYIAAIAVFTAFKVMRVEASSFYAASTFSWNFHFFWSHGRSLDDSSVLGHFWTLSVEEQFYLLWPSFLVFLGLRWSLRLASAAVVLLPLFRMGVYFLLRETAMRDGILLHTAQDQIMWGALGAFAVHHGVLVRMRAHRFRAAYPWISGLTLFVLCPVIELFSPFGLQYYLVPTLQSAAALLLVLWLLSGEGGLLRSVLELWPMVQLGLLSYSLYIWQQPFTRWNGLEWLHFPWNILLALAVAIASYRLVEVPMRRRIRRWFSLSLPAH